MQLSRLLLIIILIFSIRISAQSTASQQVDTFKIEAPQLKVHKKIWVYLPKSYQNSQNSYPVIYMHDGQNLFDAKTSYVGEWKIDEYLDSISENEAIIIGIEHGNEKRIDELTPFKNEKYGGGHADDYLDFIRMTLKPHVDVTYRTKPEAKNTGIFGSSLGGLTSFYATIKYPETFGNAGVFSSSFWYSDEIYEYVVHTEIHPSLRFYFMAGTDEDETMVTKLEEMVSLLKDKGVEEKNLKVKIVEGGKHNEETWSKEFLEAFMWLVRY